MKLIKTLLLSVCIFSVFSLPSLASEDRVLNAQEKFHQVLQKTAKKQVAVAAFFVNDMPLEKVREALQNTPLEVRDFRHGTQASSGGYTIKAGETVGEAIENYQRDHLFFLQKQLEIEDDLLTTEINEKLRNAIISHRKEADHLQKDFSENGLRIIGVELYGQAVALQNFKKKHSFVRVLEIKEKGKPQSAILPQF